MVASFNETATIWLRAISPPLRIASATSPALPRPTPTRPRLSPTTMRALKLKRRPPLTTLAERLMNTTFSVSSCSWPSLFKSLGSGPGRFLRERNPPRGPTITTLVQLAYVLLFLPTDFFNRPESAGAARRRTAEQDHRADRRRQRRLRHVAARGQHPRRGRRAMQDRHGLSDGRSLPVRFLHPRRTEPMPDL